MGRIIIGIHGLKNKPPKNILSKWWKQALKEGLKNIGWPLPFIPFEMICWSPHVFTRPLDPKLTEESDPLFIVNPYRPAQEVVRRHPGGEKLKDKVRDSLERALSGLFKLGDPLFNFDKQTDIVLRRFFMELYAYYHKHPSLKRPQTDFHDCVIKEVCKILKKNRHKKIMLIGHSMGSIIAYDALIKLESEPGITIDSLVTVGSPLGLPFFVKKILDAENRVLQNKRKKPRTPENITGQWLNFTDLEDRAAFDYNLANDFAPNAQNIKPHDVIVYNAYQAKYAIDHHNPYGYLRVPELSDALLAFLNRGIYKWLFKLSRLF